MYFTIWFVNRRHKKKASPAPVFGLMLILLNMYTIQWDVLIGEYIVRDVMSSTYWSEVQVHVLSASLGLQAAGPDEV